LNQLLQYNLIAKKQSQPMLHDMSDRSYKQKRPPELQEVEDAQEP
jgi:hypothetical protein